MRKDFSARIVNLQEAYRAACQVANKIDKAAEKFDCIVAIARGGFAPGRFLCDLLNIRQMGSLQMTHYSAGASKQSELSMLAELNMDIRDKRVLLVDDVNDSGETLKAVYDYLCSKSAKTLKIAVLHEKPNTILPADYVGIYLKDWKWLIYQWAMTEDLLSFIKKDNLLDAEPAALQTALLERYQLKISRQRLAMIMSRKDHYIPQEM